SGPIASAYRGRSQSRTAHRSASGSSNPSYQGGISGSVPLSPRSTISTATGLNSGFACFFSLFTFAIIHQSSVMGFRRQLANPARPADPPALAVCPVRTESDRLHKPAKMRISPGRSFRHRALNPFLLVIGQARIVSNGSVNHLHKPAQESHYFVTPGQRTF